MAAQFKECLARLSDVEDADDVGVGGECGEEMVVVWGGSEAEKRWWGGESLLGECRAHAAAIGI